MQIISATKTAKETILNRKRNLFGLGLTSLIAACGDKAAGTDGTGGGGKFPATPAGDIGDRPANPVPAKLTVTAGQLAEASGERLAPVTDIDSDHISASTKDSRAGDPMDDGFGRPRSANLNDLVVTIKADSGLLKGDNDFEMTFKNGDHTADPLVSVYQLKEGTNDLVVTSPDFGDVDGSNIGGAVYIVWDIKSRDTTTLDDSKISNIYLNDNFLKIGGSGSTPIGNYEPNFLHIGGVDAAGNKPQYDMILGADGTLAGGKLITYIYIVWDVTKYAGTDYQNLNLTNTEDRFLHKMTIASHQNIDMNEYAPEFFNIGGDEYHDMIIRGVGTDGANDNIYIIWDVANPTFKTAVIDLGGSRGGFKALNIYIERGDDKIASYAPEFSHIGGDDAQYDMVIRSGVDATAGGIYVLWDVAGSTSISIVLNSPSGNTGGVTHGLLRIFGEATNKTIGAYSPEFLQIGGVGDTANSNAPQQDMIIKSNDGSTIYILWDVAAYYNSAMLATPVDVDLSSSPAHGLLKITGENIGAYSPEFLQIAGTDTQEDMVIRSDTAIYVLWDVAEYHSAASTPIDLSSTSIANGLLKITGTTASEKIGQSAPDILKINNNDDYDMIIKSDANMYVLWDFTKDYSATTPAEISLTDASATNGNGLLTISGANAADVLKKDDGSFDDIDSNGINDIVFTDGGNTFILFGEQLAYRDVDGKAVSHEVDLTGINSLDFGGSNAGFFTADAVVTPTTKADLADAIGYRFADTETDIGTVKADYEALFNSIPSTELSGADAGAGGVWDIV